ncbi:hypothetical protein MTR67_052309 [Solanum verrucosum]|uniref:ACT domain-containing protein ACR n=1 Tax=Solanum verrucosum TaxID=315347 RepID=A0AAF1A3F1_SOLVR|nr:hypothetical protein MTR67_052309 [Solanum verrucosum]
MITNDRARINSRSARPRLLSEVSTVLTNLKCNAANAKVWTHNAPASAIVQVTGKEIKREAYFVVTIRCKDRQKLLVNTIFTLADMQYLVFHGNSDAEGQVVHQVQFSISFKIFFSLFIFLKM